MYLFYKPAAADVISFICILCTNDPIYPLYIPRTTHLKSLIVILFFLNKCCCTLTSLAAPKLRGADTLQICEGKSNADAELIELSARTPRTNRSNFINATKHQHQHSSRKRLRSRNPIPGCPS